MKKVLLLLILIRLPIYAEDLRSDVENFYAKAANTLLFFTSDNIISSGSYEFGSEDSVLDTTSFPLTHHFKSDSDFYNFYINGGIGYSKYRAENINSDSTGSETIKVKTFALKLGVGIRVNIQKDIDMMIGGSYIYSKVNSDYYTSKTLDLAGTVANVHDHVFNSNDHFNTYKFQSSIGYHPTINEYKPYLRADIRYFYTKINDTYSTISDTVSTVSKLKIGVITPFVVTIVKLPLKIEFYASDIFIAGDMKEILDSNSFYVLGTTFHLDGNTLHEWISEIFIDINIVRGDNVEGFNVGLGLSF